MKKNLLLLLCLTLLFAASSYGQGHSAPFPICTVMGDQIIIQAAYNPIADEFLVVWEDGRKGMDDDIYGQILNGDGTLKGPEIPICTTAGHQWWPRLDFDPVLKQFLIVFEDWRDPDNGDIRGIFIKDDGTKVMAPTSDTDTTFAICSNAANVYTTSVAFNYTDRIYLVVWGDFRNDVTMDSWTGEDVFGQLVAADGTLLPPPDPADPSMNFEIAASTEYDESVADVSYSSITNEWFVVFGTNIGYVLGQRVNNLGKLVNPDGSVVAKTSGWGAGMQLSVNFMNGCDCLNPRIQFNSEYNATIEIGKQTATPWCEAEAAWRGTLLPRPDDDFYGQRVGFFFDGSKYTARYVAEDGTVSDTLSNHNISIQDERPNPIEISFSAYDNEWLTAWGDWRNSATVTGVDLYGQRLGVFMSDTSMSLLADDRINTVSDTKNIIYQNEERYEGYVIGIAHSIYRNHFLVAYERLNDAGEMDVYGFIVHGTIPTDVSTEENLQPKSFAVEQNYPNPFNPETTIGFGLPEREYVTVTIYDITGRKVKRVLDAIKPAGYHSVVWNGKDAAGNEMASGLYLYTIRIGREVITKKMTLMR